MLLIKENQVSQVEEVITFLCIGRCESLGSLKSFLSYVSQLSRAVAYVFFHMHLLQLLRAHRREWLQLGGCQIAY